MVFTTKIVIFFTSFCVFITFCETISYTHLDFCDEIEAATPCSQRSLNPASHCTDYEKLIHSNVEKRAILDRINSRRNKVASGEIRSLPSANNMRKLRWNTVLEESAQKWANQCVRGSVPDVKDECLDMANIGQNIATVYGDAPGIAAQSLVDIWYMELLNINSSIIYGYRPTSPETTSYDHFTQLIWAESTDVGCGAVRFKECVKEQDYKKNITVYRLVCNFSPGGNIINEEVFQTGPPCSQCPIQNICDSMFNSLCPEEILYTEPTKTSNIATTVTELNELNTEAIFDTSTEKQKTKDDEQLTPYDFLSNLRHLSIPTISLPTTTHKTIVCSDGVKVDDLVEILKKKLSTDTVFKEIIDSKNKQANVDFTDSKVQEFVSRIYTSKMPNSTPVTSESEYVNSTLLADLIEAVIFRNAQRNDAHLTSTEFFGVGQTSNPIFPKKIQAELAEIPINTYFTGHFFIPEEVEDGDTKATTETDFESYGDKSTEVVISEVLSQIERIRKQKATKDFLSELLETEYGTESVESKNRDERNNEETSDNVSPTITGDSKVRKKRNGMSIKNNKHRQHKPNFNIPRNAFGSVPSLKSNDQDHSQGYMIKYSDLLKQIAADVRSLKLHEKFACAWSANKSCKISSLYFTQVLFALFLIN